MSQYTIPEEPVVALANKDGIIAVSVIVGPRTEFSRAEIRTNAGRPMGITTETMKTIAAAMVEIVIAAPQETASLQIGNVRVAVMRYQEPGGPWAIMTVFASSGHKVAKSMQRFMLQALKKIIKATDLGQQKAS